MIFDEALYLLCLQFTGYDVGNKLIHVSGITTSMFPCDGGQIRTERVEFVQGWYLPFSTCLANYIYL